MKNFKKSLALLVACVMVFGMVAFAAYPDVPSDTNYANAVETLSQLKVIVGDEKGNFNPDQTIIRSEAAKIMCILLGTGELAPQQTTFKDVVADHWAGGYINYVNANNIMIGFSADTFGPDETLTYEQFVKMLVIALGYNPMAIDKAKNKEYPYPEGYISAAAAIGLTNNAPGSIGLQVKRSTIAVLSANALDINLMVSNVVTGIGGVSYTTTEILDGKKDRDYATLATKYLNAYKVKGTVDNTSKTSDLKVGYVDFTVSADYGALEFITVGTNVAESNPRQPNIIDRTGKASDFLNVQSVAYLLKTDDGIYEIISIFEDKSKNNSFNIDKITNVETGSDTTFGPVTAPSASPVPATGTLKLAYYTNRDTDRTTKKLDVAATAPLYINGTQTTLTAGTADINTMITATGTVGSLQLLDSDNNGIYDFIYATKYTNYVVKDGSSAEKQRIATKTQTINLDPEYNDNLEGYTLTLDGVAIGIGNLKEGDVLNVKYPYGSNATNAKYIDIIVTRNTVEGSVGEKDNKNNVYIGGTKYEVIGTAPVPGDSGKFYLNIEGKIVGYDITSTISDNYAYAYSFKKGDSFTGTRIKVMDTEGRLKTVELKTDLKLNGEKVVVETGVVNVSIDSGAKTTLSANDFLAIITTGTMADGTAVSPAITDKLRVYKADGTTEYTTYTKNQLKYARMFVLGTDSSGYVTSIDLPKLSANVSDTSREFDIVDMQTGSKEYDGMIARLNGYKLGSGTKIFYINGTNDSDYELKTTATLEDKDVFTDYVMFDQAKNTNEIGAVLVFNFTAGASVKAPLAVVTGITTGKDADQNDIVNVKVLESGTAKTLVAKDETVTSNDVNFTGNAADDLRIGDVITYQKDTKGNVNKIQLQMRTSASDYNLYAKYPAGGTAVNVNALMTSNLTGDKNGYKYGYMMSQSGEELTISPTGQNQDFVVIDDQTNVYVYDTKLTTNEVKLGDAGLIDLTDYTSINNTERIDFSQPVKPVYVLARIYDGLAKEVIVIKY